MEENEKRDSKKIDVFEKRLKEQKIHLEILIIIKNHLIFH